MRVRVPVAIFLAACCACSSAQDQYNVRRSNVSCDEANRYAFRSVRSMGYVVTAFEPAEIGRAGSLHGVKKGTEDRGDGKRSGTVHITCDSNEVRLSADDGSMLGQDFRFARGFFLAFSSLADYARVSEAYADEQAGGTATGGAKLKIEPQIGLESKLDFGHDLEAGGVLAVRLTLKNGSDRTYRFDPGTVELRPREGRGKTLQMSISAAAAGVTRAAAADRGEGAPAPDAARIETLLRERSLTSRLVAPGETVEGFLYFPVGEYGRARATLIDTGTDPEEEEGFLVEF